MKVCGHVKMCSERVEPIDTTGLPVVTFVPPKKEAAKAKDADSSYDLDQIEAQEEQAAAQVIPETPEAPAKEAPVEV